MYYIVKNLANGKHRIHRKYGAALRHVRRKPACQITVVDGNRRCIVWAARS